MNALDEVLARSAQLASVSARESAVELARSVADQRRRGTRRRWVAAVIVTGSLVLGGGAVGAAAQAGWVALPWVDGADSEAVYTVTLANKHVYECPYALHVQGDYQADASYAKIQAALAEAKRYIRTIDLQSIKPDQKFMNGPQAQHELTEEQDEAADIRQGWSFGVREVVNQHLAKMGLPDVNFEGIVGARELVPR